MNLLNITRDLGEVHAINKESAEQLKSLRKDFFKLADEELSKKPLPRRVVKIPFEVDDARARQIVESHNPGWRVIMQDGLRFQIEQLPEFITFVYVNEDDGKRYKRRVDNGNPTLDDELLREFDPELWDEITEWPHYLVLENILHENNVDPGKIDAEIQRVFEEYGYERTVKDPHTWTPKQQKRAEKYWYTGKPKVVLEEPKQPKAEELEESGA